MKGQIIEESDIQDLGTTFRATYVLIKDKWEYTARLSSLLDMIQYSYGISEWDLLDYRTVNNGTIESEIIDSYIDFANSRPVNFKNIWEKIKKSFDFSQKELDLIESGNIDERLWAIFNLLLNPNLNIKY